jgi:ATP synthase, F1 delta subunit
MADARVASRYVKSLLGLAVEKGVLEPVNNDMKMFDRICTSNRDLVSMLRSPIIRHEKKRDILEKIFKGKVNSLTFDIIDILTRKNREPLLPAIAKEFHVAYNEYKGIGKATVTTTVPMDAALRSEIESIVKQLSHRDQIELVEKVDANLLGGFVLNVDDRQICLHQQQIEIIEIKVHREPVHKRILNF